MEMALFNAFLTSARYEVANEYRDTYSKNELTPALPGYTLFSINDFINPLCLVRFVEQLYRMHDY